MISDKKTPKNLISDNEFQKVNWKKNKIKFNKYLYNIDEITSWVESNINGKWHYKENWNLSSSPHIINFCFWFEMSDDALLFKLQWWSEQL